MGTKLEKSAGGSVTQYTGNYIYSGALGSETLQFFSQPEGYVTPNGLGSYDYVYQYKDHLGNVRLSYQDSNGNYQDILNSDFELDFDGWEQNGSVNYTLENGRLKANVNSAWEGVKHTLSGITTVAGEILTVKVDFDKGNTQSNVRVYLPEYDSNNNLVRYNAVTSNLTTGHHEFTLTMLDTGNNIGYLRIDKDNTNTGTETYFYIDHVSLSRGKLEILEENNYYPFGLKHKGYNNVTSSFGNSVAQKWKFGGKELSEENGLDTYDFGARNYDPALGRWMNLDPLAEQMRRHSPYNYAFDNPVYFIDPDGMAPYDNCPTCPGGPIPTYGLRIGVAVYNAIADFANLPPVDIEGDAKSDWVSADKKRTSEEDRVTVVVSDSHGDNNDTTDAPTTFIDGDAIRQAGGYALSGKDLSNSSNGPSRKGPENKSMAREVAETGNKTKSGMETGNKAAGTITSKNQSEPDSTTVIATRETGNITTTVNPPHSVTSTGGTENVQVRVPTNRVDSVNNASAQARKNAEARMQQINQSKLDSLISTYY